MNRRRFLRALAAVPILAAAPLVVGPITARDDESPFSGAELRAAARSGRMEVRRHRGHLIAMYATPLACHPDAFVARYWYSTDNGYTWVVPA